MKAKIGRTVIYRTTQFDKDGTKLFGNTQEELPATIVAVWSNTCVNLKVHCDAPIDLWKTSVQQGTLEGQWSWPIIEKE